MRDSKALMSKEELHDMVKSQQIGKGGKMFRREKKEESLNVGKRVSRLKREAVADKLFTRETVQKMNAVSLRPGTAGICTRGLKHSVVTHRVS